MLKFKCHVLELKRRERLLLTRRIHGWETGVGRHCCFAVVSLQTLAHGFCEGEGPRCALCRRSSMRISVRRGQQRPSRPMTSRLCVGPCCMQPGRPRTSRCYLICLFCLYLPFALADVREGGEPGRLNLAFCRQVHKGHDFCLRSWPSAYLCKCPLSRTGS